MTIKQYSGSFERLQIISANNATFKEKQFLKEPNLHVQKKEYDVLTENCRCQINHHEEFKIIKMKQSNNKLKSSIRIKLRRMLNRLSVLPLTLPL
jgi:hypothetical protein